MTDEQIAQEIGCGIVTVQRMRMELDMARNGHGKITSPGIEPLTKYMRRLQGHLNAAGITGDEARMFMRQWVWDRAREMQLAEYRLRLNTPSGSFDNDSKSINKLRLLQAECYYKLQSLERKN